jgi:hypothetical protein
MTRIKKRAWFPLILIISLCLGLPGLYFAGRQLAAEQREEIYPGVIYYRKVHRDPRPMVAHIVTVDLTNPNISFLVTPPDDRKGEFPLRARTTLQFAKEQQVQIAVNGDGFTPWYSNNLFDYYPHKGDPVKPNGFAASRGIKYSYGSEPTLFFAKDNTTRFNQSVRTVYNAISGDRMLMENGKVIEDLADVLPAPRSAIGLDHGRTKLIIIVVDGRQPFYSEGATVAELGELLKLYGAESAMNLDGGGSSTLVIQFPGGNPKVINSPIDNYLPGRQRAIANHLGILISTQK